MRIVVAGLLTGTIMVMAKEEINSEATFRMQSGAADGGAGLSMLHALAKAWNEKIAAKPVAVYMLHSATIAACAVYALLTRHPKTGVDSNYALGAALMIFGSNVVIRWGMKLKERRRPAEDASDAAMFKYVEP